MSDKPTVKQAAEFHKWLIRTAPRWVVTVAQSYTVYQAMVLAYEAGKRTHSTSGGS